MRALTSQTIVSTKTDDTSKDQDVILITRLFAVPLADSKEPVVFRSKSGDNITSVTSPISEDGSAGKKTKLIEKKTPMYAVALMVSLPSEESRSMFRPPSRMSSNSMSFPNSYGSDCASSWTLLDAIPDSLASSVKSSKHFDHRIESLANIWDVILRSLSDVETVAKIEVRHVLDFVNQQFMLSTAKVPKGPNEQRTNQRNIYIKQEMALGHLRSLDSCSRHLVKRVSLALRIPKVITGVGFRRGNWREEARYLSQLGGSKPQNQFLLNVLTAFLGTYTAWLGIIPDPRFIKSHEAAEQVEAKLGSDRTVIIGDQRSVARRFVFLLASFLPTASGANPFQRQTPSSRSPLPTPRMASSSPLKQSRPPNGKRHGQNGDAGGPHVSFGAIESAEPSTSASSIRSVAIESWPRPLKPTMERKDSDTISVRAGNRFVPMTHSSVHMRKASAANSTVTPQGVSSTPFQLTQQDSYFPEHAVADSAESVASGQLAQILRRNSSSSSIMPRSLSGGWGFLGRWSRKATSSGTAEDLKNGVESHYGSDAAPGRAPSKREGPILESMVGEAASVAIPQAQQHHTNAPGVDEDARAAVRPVLPEPRLRVDEQDGVVDVHMGILGFTGWDADDTTTSPSRHAHPSSMGRSLDGITSMRSSFSHPASQALPSFAEDSNVAGYLRHYHEDFRLQAVRPYPELVAEVRDSMIRESMALLSRNPDAVPNDENAAGDDVWLDISSTVLIDLRKFTIERLTLRRKVSKRTSAESQGSSLLSQPALEIEHRFTSIPVTTPDAMLASAVEGILGMTKKSVHSRSASSTANSETATPPATYAADSNLLGRSIGASYNQAVVEALEQVVKSVGEDLVSHENGRDITRNIGEAKKQPEQNILREGVKQWLLKPELRNVW